MATFLIGDIQGCQDALLRLLARIDYRPGIDVLWLAGDLVNRGPDSLATLRWAMAEPNLVAVLGNHDLHLLGRADGLRRAREDDTLDAILAAPDCSRLLTWLAERPFLYAHEEIQLVHAGLYSEWTLKEAHRLARLAESQLRGGLVARERFFSEMRQPSSFDSPDGSRASHVSVGEAARLMTNIRMCRLDGTPLLHLSCPPQDAPEDVIPWFAVASRQTRRSPIAFGHWAALGLHVGDNTFGLDTGCVWGRELTAMRLHDKICFSVPAKVT